MEKARERKKWSETKEDTNTHTVLMSECGARSVDFLLAFNSALQVIPG
jgi:hypothetical protein